MCCSAVTAYRASWPVMQRLVPLLAELVQVGGIDELRQIVVYMAATTREPERWHRFADAVRRHVPGGAELMNKTQEMLEIYGEVIQQEARQKGLLTGRQEGRREGPSGRCTDDSGANHRGIAGPRCSVGHDRSGHRNRRDHIWAAQAATGGHRQRHQPSQLSHAHAPRARRPHRRHRSSSVDLNSIAVSPPCGCHPRCRRSSRTCYAISDTPVDPRLPLLSTGL